MASAVTYMQKKCIKSLVYYWLLRDYLSASLLDAVDQVIFSLDAGDDRVNLVLLKSFLETNFSKLCEDYVREENYLLLQVILSSFQAVGFVDDILN